MTTPTTTAPEGEPVCNCGADPGYHSITCPRFTLELHPPPAQSLPQGTTGDPFEGHPIIQKALADFEAELPTPETDAATHDDWSGGAEATKPEVSRSLERRLAAAMAERDSLRVAFENGNHARNRIGI